VRRRRPHLTAALALSLPLSAPEAWAADDGKRSEPLTAKENGDEVHTALAGQSHHTRWRDSRGHSVGADASQPYRQVAGTWAYKQATLGSGQVVMTLTQTGNKATGNLLVTGTPTERSGSVTILLSGNDAYLVYPTGFTGYLTVSGDEMKGELDGQNPANVVLKRQKQ